MPGQFAMPWQAFERDGHFYYLLNKKHPVYERARAAAEDTKAFDALITLVEQTLPYADIVIRNGEKPESFPQPFEDISDSERLKNLRELFAVYLSIAGTREKALEMISKTPPYSGFKDEISKL